VICIAIPWSAWWNVWWNVWWNAGRLESAQVIERIDIGRGSGVRAIDLDDAVALHQGAGADIARETARLAPEGALDEHGVRSLAVVRRDSQRGTVVVRRSEALVRLGGDERLVGKPDADGIDLHVGLERVQGRPQ
jgi:hypothetical protein